MEGCAQRVWAAQDALQPLHPLGRLSFFDRIFAALAGEGPKPNRFMMARSDACPKVTHVGRHGLGKHNRAGRVGFAGA